MGMKRAIIVMLLLFLMAGCSYNLQPRAPQPQPEEQQKEQFEHVIYTREGNDYLGIVYQDAINAMEWVQLNTPQEAVFLCWWDYGHTIRSATERDVIVWEPSREILFTVAKYAAMSEEERAAVECPHCLPHERIADVLDALLTEDPAVTAEVMGKYGAEYAFVSKGDSSKAYAMFLAAGKEPSPYLTSEYEPTKAAFELVLFKMINLEELPGFEIAYLDDDTRIYRLTS